MSRIGKVPVEIPSWVTVTLDWSLVKVAGPKWNLEHRVHESIAVKQEDSSVVVSIQNQEDKWAKGFWGLTRTLIQNMITWVTKWFEKKLEIVWVGYRAAVQWTKLNLTLWFSHPVELEIPQGLIAEMDKDAKNVIVLTWIDKQKLWQFAAEIREYRPPEPYKGKWIRYLWEYVARKAGKAAAK